MMPCRLPPGASSSCRTAALRAAGPSITTQPRIIITKANAIPLARSLTTATRSRPPASPAPPRSHPVHGLFSRLRSHHPGTDRTRTHTRTYHSYDHLPPQGPFSPTERALLSAAYAYVPAHGFTHDTLALGARDAGYLDISTNLLPEGVFSLVRWHLVSQREDLARRAAELFAADGEAAAAGVGRKVEALTWARLMGNTAVLGRWQEALAIMAQPTCVPESLRELAKLSDEIWFLAGDVSVDPSWYTKRASLSAIYASAELFMTTDTSEGFVETRRFLRRRLDEVQGAGSTLRSLGQWVGFTASAGLNVLRSKGARI